MSDPRQEARDIIRNVGTLDWQSGAAWGHYCERVVEALGAAIELHDVLDVTPLNDVAEWLPANERLHASLSALRGEQR